MSTHSTTGTAAGSDPLAVVNALLAAENAHDVEAAVALFADDAIATLAIETRRGTTEIRAWQQELAAGHFHMEVLGSFEVTGDAVRFANRLGLDMFRKLGLDTVEAVSEATVRDGKIVAYSFTLSPASAAQLQAAASNPPK